MIEERINAETRKGEHEIRDFPYHDPDLGVGCGFREVMGEYEDNVVERSRMKDEFRPSGKLISMTKISRQVHGPPKMGHLRPGYKYTGEGLREKYQAHKKDEDNGFPYHDPYKGGEFEKDHHPTMEAESDMQLLWEELHY